jgi:hypothetical protein
MALRLSAVQSSRHATSSRGATAATLAFRASAGPGHPFMVLLHDTRAPEPAEWKRYLDALSATVATASARVHVFIVTDGGGPNAAQRKELAAVLERGPVDALSHIFTTDAFVRGIVTAFRWIAHARAVAHHPRELAAVCADCGHAPEDVLAELATLQAAFPPVATLRVVEESIYPARMRA